MAARFVYGHLDDGNGAGFIRLDAGIPKEACYKYMGYDGVGNVTRVNYDPVSENLYMLVFTTKLPQGSSVEKREQIFTDGYGFTKEEIMDLMKKPEKLLDIPFYASLDDYKENMTTTLRTKGKKLEKVKTSKPQAMTYFYSVLNNAEKRMENQVIHIVDPFAPEKWQKNLMNALKIFPLEIRIGISFCINPYSVSEINDSEWNFVSKEVYDHFVASGYEGGRVMDRYIVTDTGTEEFHVTVEKKNFWEEYKKVKDDISEILQDTDGDRMTFIKMLTEMMVPKETEVEMGEEKDRRSIRIEKHEKRVHKRAGVLPLVIGECLVLIVSIGYLVAKFHVSYKPAIPYMNIRVDNSVFVFFVQFIVVFFAVAVVGHMKKMMKGNRERTIE